MNYIADTHALIWWFIDEAAIVESEEVEPGVILDFNSDGKVVGIEILELSKRTPSDQLKILQYETV